ncbi:cell wall-binding repeat-containing protein [Microbacterium saperdae]|uniref:Fibronectin type III domain protein n=1 Tax=Microbacterium saperdae TaxID=69368 RepID=A0A543BP95_9MICO|nr:cell wall-binding repeat-containing protein [Microbacterium saperdae]TQL86657.1 fibronectin type III domain protein [Microbacterium saperdae]GGM46374.1 hypothetical protein GCM10010489_16940 [Microbacterium saperdae]
MSSRQSRRIVAVATIVALSLTGAIAANADSVDDPALLPPLDASPGAQELGQGARFHLDESVAAAPRSTQDARRAASAPAVVTGVASSEVTATGARVTWTAPADNGSPLTGYHLQLLFGGSVIDEIVSSSPITGTTISELQPDKNYEFRVAAVNAIGTGPFSTPVSFQTSHSSIERQFGADRFETAVQVSQNAFPYSGVPVTFLANGLNFPDALAAAAAAGAFGGPVLLTRPGSVDQSTVDEVAALEPEYVIAAGGSAVVSDSVFSKVAQHATVGSERAAGSSRYQTAGLISTLWESVGTVYLANGTNFPDALAGAAAAGYNNAPVLLTKKDSLPAETAAYLSYHNPTRLIILGGPGAVSEAVVNQAQRASGSVAFTQRLFGDSRYDTAVEISRQTYTSPRVPVVYVASGQNFADALAGAGAAGALGGPVLLTDPSSISNATLAEISRLDPIRVVVLGGPSVVTPAVYAEIEAAIG